jgi:hypothetical protein
MFGNGSPESSGVFDTALIGRMILGQTFDLIRVMHSNLIRGLKVQIVEVPEKLSEHFIRCVDSLVN